MLVKPSDSLRIWGCDKKPWIAQLVEARQHHGQIWIHVIWWYTDNDLPAYLRMPEIRESWELIGSNHHEIVSSECVQGTAKVGEVCEMDDDGVVVAFPHHGFLTRQKYDRRRNTLSVSQLIARNDFY